MDDSRRKFVKGVLALGALAATGGCMQSSDKPARWISGGPDVDPVSGPKVKFVRTDLPGLPQRLRPAVQGGGRRPGEDRRQSLSPQ